MSEDNDDAMETLEKFYRLHNSQRDANQPVPPLGMTQDTAYPAEIYNSLLAQGYSREQARADTMKRIQQNNKWIRENPSKARGIHESYLEESEY